MGGHSDGANAAGNERRTAIEAWIAARQFARIMKWLLWASFLGFSLYVMYNRAHHINHFGHPTLNRGYPVWIADSGRGRGPVGTHVS
jgi:hypothetical protein